MEPPLTTSGSIPTARRLAAAAASALRLVLGRAPQVVGRVAVAGEREHAAHVQPAARVASSATRPASSREHPAAVLPAVHLDQHPHPVGVVAQQQTGARGTVLGVEADA